KWLTEKFGDTYKNYRPHEVGEFWVKYIPEQIPGLQAKVLGKDLKNFEKILQKRPLVLATKLTTAGHLVCGVDYKDGFFTVLDPYKKESEEMGLDRIPESKVVWALDISEA